MAFEKKTYALAMLGSAVDINNISEPLKSKGILLSKRNYVSLDEIEYAILNNKGIEYVFLSDDGMLGIRDGKYIVPSKLVSLNKELCIVLFFNMEKRDDRYLKWAAGLDIHHIYYSNDSIYTDDSGGFNFNKVLREVKEKKRIYSKEAVPDDEVDDSESVPRSGQTRVIKVEVEKVVEREVPVDRIVEKEVIREVEVPVEVIREVPVEKIIEREIIRQIPVGIPMQMQEPSSSEVSKSMIKEALQEILGQHSQGNDVLTTPEIVPEQVLRKPSSMQRGVSLRKAYVKDVYEDSSGNQRVVQKSIESYKEKSHISIGVFGLTHGAGATTVAVDVAEAISKAGYGVAVVAYDGKKDLEYARRSTVSYMVPEMTAHKKDVLIETRMKGFQFVVIDFGTPIELSPQGDIINVSNEEFQELIRCQYKICLGFSNSWNMGKVNYFLNNSDIHNNESYILALSDIPRKRGLERLNVTLSDRDSNSNQIIEKLLRKIYMR